MNDEINLRIRAKKEKKDRAKKEEQERLQKIKDGIRIFHALGPGVYQFDFVGWDDKTWVINLAIVYKREGELYYTYSICSPRDVFSWRMAKSIIGNRLKESNRICFVNYNTKDLISKSYSFIALEHFVKNILKLPGIPKKLRIQIGYHYTAKDLYR